MSSESVPALSVHGTLRFVFILRGGEKREGRQIAKGFSPQKNKAKEITQLRKSSFSKPRYPMSSNGEAYNG